MDCVGLGDCDSSKQPPERFTVIMFIFIDILNARGKPDVCLSLEPDGEKKR